MELMEQYRFIATKIRFLMTKIFKKNLLDHTMSMFFKRYKVFI